MRETNIRAYRVEANAKDGTDAGWCWTATVGGESESWGLYATHAEAMEAATKFVAERLSATSEATSEGAGSVQDTLAAIAQLSDDLWDVNDSTSAWYRRALLEADRLIRTHVLGDESAPARATGGAR